MTHDNASSINRRCYEAGINKAPLFPTFDSYNQGRSVISFHPFNKKKHNVTTLTLKQYLRNKFTCGVLFFDVRIDVSLI